MRILETLLAGQKRKGAPYCYYTYYWSKQLKAVKTIVGGYSTFLHHMKKRDNGTYSCMKPKKHGKKLVNGGVKPKYGRGKIRSMIGRFI